MDELKQLTRAAKFVMRFTHRKIITTLALCIRGASLAYPESSAAWRRRRLRFLVRSVIWWEATIPWMLVCFGSRHAEIVRQFPWLIERIHRPFLHRSLTAWQRLAVSVEHAYLSRAMAPRVVEELARDGLCPLAMISSSGQRWYVQIEMLSRFGKEGDWTLTIRDSKGHRLVSCTFSIATLGGRRQRPRLLIGCVQGPDRCVDGRALYRTLTKQWHGMRPKSLVIYLTQSMANALGLQSVLMVDNESHVYATWRYRSPKHRIAADYRALCAALRMRVWQGWLVLGIPQARKEHRDEACEEQCGTIRAKRRLLKNSLDVQIRSSVEGCLASRAMAARSSNTLF
ncbi:DUF535 domain-containing protein [Paraburkholderia sp. Tr-20389]|uniref:DUF535 family protein n=1 Tax=Paraburkholderia sp. Tr-20389 TaxID=2703903 RepID=UPI0019808E11|nr:DUF535 family protein [Paraburkholderia sp. Tr-20389]MBN3758563.1 DUF535 domain-containing protein [Paraburkholderia sp. Tr-20389]